MDVLRHAVIHSLDKEARSGVATVRFAPRLLDTALPQVLLLATQLASLVGRDGSTVYWGQFRSDRREGMFPGEVSELSTAPSESRFSQVAVTAMNELRSAAAEEALATGGYVCFLEFSSNGAEFLLVAMIKERGALALNEEMVPEQITEIDLSKLHQAARFNLTRYAAHQASNEEGEEAPDLEPDAVERTYLCFVNRTARHDIARYFIEALGCQPGVSSVRTTRALIKHVHSFFKKSPRLRAFAKPVKRRLIDHLASLPDGSRVTLDEVVVLARQVAGPDNRDVVEEMTGYLNGDDVQIPHEFNISSKTVETFSRLVVSNDAYKIAFDLSSLGERDSPIVYNQDERTLTLKNIPAANIRVIEQTIADRRQEQD